MSAQTKKQPEEKVTPYRDRTSEEVRAIVKAICATARTKDDVRRRIQEQLGYDGTIAITSNSHGPMIMFMVMLHGPNGETINA